MTAVILALVCALSYGASDFLGGLGSRRASFMRVAVVAQAAATVSVLVAASFVGGRLTGEGVLWGVLSGVGAGTGSLALYRGLGRGEMSVVGPISGVGTAVIPALAGLALGERPSAVTLIGVALILPAVYLIARGEDPSPAVGGVSSVGGAVGGRVGGDRAGPVGGRGSGLGAVTGGVRGGVTDGALAGVGFGSFFLALSQAGSGDGLWPSAASTVAATILILGFVLAVPSRPGGIGGPGGGGPGGEPAGGERAGGDTAAGASGAMTGTTGLTAIAAGVCAGAASAMYLLATRQGLLVVVAVLASLYPAVTVLLARAVLHERSSRSQVVGLAMAAGAVVAITAG